MDWLDLLAVQGTLKSLLQHHSSKASILQHSAFFIVKLSHPYMTTGKTKAMTRRTFVGKVMSLLLNMLSRLVITFLPRSKHLFFFIFLNLFFFFNTKSPSVQFSCSVVSDSSDPMNRSTPGLPVHHRLLEFTQTSIESVMPSSHLILCRPLFFLPRIPPSIRVFSNESTLRMRWPKYWSFSFSIFPSK